MTKLESWYIGDRLIFSTQKELDEYFYDNNDDTKKVQAQQLLNLYHNELVPKMKQKHKHMQSLENDIVKLEKESREDAVTAVQLFETIGGDGPSIPSRPYMFTDEDDIEALRDYVFNDDEGVEEI